VSHFARLSARAEQSCVPVSALFELTGRCNLDCAHCHLDIAHPPPELTTAEALDVIDQLADAGTLFLTLSGGELFLRPDALTVAAHARARGLALKIFTNATRIDRALAERIVALRPLSVEVSLYGSHAALHDGVTQRRRALRRTLRGLVHLRRAGATLVLKAPLVHAAAGDVDGLHALATRLGARLTFDPLVKPRTDGEAAPLALRADDHVLARAIANPRSGLKQPSLPERPAADEAPCALARRTVKIDPIGNVFPCVSWPDPVGNLRRARFAEVWRGGPLLDQLRALRWRDLHGDCDGCGQAGYCHRCTAVALLEDGDLYGPSREACRIADATERAHGLTPAARGRLRLPVVA
jgi:radical SAM protein with 4Fe4S-binding SPASM domain